LEKCQDSINYIRFLWCIGNEEMDKYTREGVCPDDAKYQVEHDGEVIGYTNTPNNAYWQMRNDFEQRLQSTGGSHDHWWQHDCIKDNCSDGVTADIQR
jgi:hypothetical protein